MINLVWKQLLIYLYLGSREKNGGGKDKNGEHLEWKSSS
jgi:hypothetical protein